MRRREFMTLLGSAPIVWPLAARAQQAMPVIGVLGSQSLAAMTDVLSGFRSGLSELGFAEGQNVKIEYRWAEDQYDRLPAMADELVRQNVSAIVASGGNVTIRAAKAATAKIPIVFTGATDPIKWGLVASFNRPSGNVTGVALLTIELDAKRMDLLRELVPTADIVGALLDSSRPEAEDQLRSVQAAAQAIGRPLVVASAGNDRDFDAAFAMLAQQRAGALLVVASPLFTSRREKLVEIAARHAIPTIYQFREFAAAGGLASYGASVVEAYRQAGIYVGRILKGAKPADLPVVQPTKFDLVINLKTAKTLGLSLSPNLLARADDVIE
jgi:putative ABC transport system substrate-binding protein